MYARTISTAATTHPVNVAELRDQLHMEHTDEDVTLYRMIATATEQAEAYTERAFCTQTWKMYLDTFPDEIIVPKPPLQSVTSITYVDTNGDTQTLSASTYTVDTDSEPGRIYEAYGESWPTVRDVDHAITVTFGAGYGDSAHDVPERIRHAILLLAADLYEIREPTLVGATLDESPTLTRLLDTVRVMEAE